MRCSALANSDSGKMCAARARTITKSENRMKPTSQWWHCGDPPTETARKCKQSTAADEEKGPKPHPISRSAAATNPIGEHVEADIGEEEILCHKVEEPKELVRGALALLRQCWEGVVCLPSSRRDRRGGLGTPTRGCSVGRDSPHLSDAAEEDGDHAREAKSFSQEEGGIREQHKDGRLQHGEHLFGEQAGSPHIPRHAPSAREHRPGLA